VNDSQENSNVKTSQFLPRERLIACIILAISFFAAAGIRLYNIDAAKLYFSPTRQYYSFCIAKGFYCEMAEDVSPQARRIAAINKELLDDKEPPVTEYLVAQIWRISGGQNHWAPSVVCSVFWLTGGVFVFLIAKKYTTVVAAALSTSFYLLCPFGIFMSRSFQPESLMTMMFLASIYTIFNYYEKQSTKRLFITAIVSGLAILSKVSIIFSIWSAFTVAGIYKNGIRRAIFSRKHLVFVILGIGPAFVYYSYLAIFTEEVRMVTESVFAPQILLESFFWCGWLSQLGSVIGFGPIIAAGFGIFVLRDKTVKSILTGLAIGYLVYVFIFNYTAATHDYYQVQLVPIVVLAASPVIAFFLRQLCQREGRCCKPAIVGCLLLLVIFVGLLAGVKTTAFKSENRFVKSSLAFGYKCFGMNPDYMSQYSADYPKFIERAETIGRIVNHSDKTITLGLVVPLWYYGQYTGYRWPRYKSWSETASHAGIGTGAKWKEYVGLGAEELFERHFLGVSPKYFILASPEETEKQQDLVNFLYRKFNLLAEGEKYLIFDLAKPKQ
jgi:hypothetical protein